jgi:hypothetical protein
MGFNGIVVSEFFGLLQYGVLGGGKVPNIRVRIKISSNLTRGDLALEVENKIFDRINKIEWFINCGKEVPIDIPYEVKYINSWNVAKKYYNQYKWEDVTLEAQNNLTVFLHIKYRSEYEEWNNIVVESKKYLKADVIPKLSLIREENNLDEGFVNTVTWDILGAMMENAYKGCKNRPIFFLDLLTIYEKGKFPCGWEGNWPEGKLIVY